MHLAGRALVHGDQAGIRARRPGQLRRQAGDLRVKQPVQARGGDLGGMREGRGELVTVRGEVDPVKPGRADEPPVQEGR